MATRRATGLPPEVADRIGPYYVYALVDPRTDEIFYIGKGTKDRVAAHGKQAGLDVQSGESDKVERIREIRLDGAEPLIDIVRHGLTADDALAIEATLIDCLPRLTNIVAGHGVEGGRTSLDDLISRYGAEPLIAKAPPVLLIRLSPWWTFNDPGEELEPGYIRAGAGWYPHIPERMLYDATRGWWKLSRTSLTRRGIHHVVPVVRGVTQALYRVDEWIGPREDGRIAFVGVVIGDGAVFSAYVGALGKRVPFVKHSQNPTHYWPGGS
jgi:hypothetical protein